MNMDFKRKLIIPQEIKEMYPLSEEGAQAKKENDAAIKKLTSENEELKKQLAALQEQLSKNNGGCKKSCVFGK